MSSELVTFSSPVSRSMNGNTKYDVQFCYFSDLTSRTAILVAGRWYVPLVVLTNALLTWPSFPITVLVTMPFGQQRRGRFGSTIITISSTSIGFTLSNHLVLLVIVGRTSATHLFQNSSASNCEWRLDLRKYWSLSSNLPVGLSPDDVPNKKWFGVRASWSADSNDRYVG